MKLLPAIHQTGLSFTEQELPSFNLVMLYDHELAAKAAERITARLLGRCLPETDIHEDRWSFDELAHAAFRNEARELAEPCDLMLVAVADGQALPLEICFWIEHWARTRIQRDAALVLLHGSVDGTLPVGTFQQLSGLDSAANVGKLVVFTSAVALFGAGKPASGSDQPALAFKSTGRPSAHSFDPRPERWGINE